MIGVTNLYIKRKYSVLRGLKGRQRMGAGTFWSECAIGAISYLCADIIMVMVLSVALPVSEETLTQTVNICAAVLAVLWCIPALRRTRMRLRDAGYTAKAYLWLLLPVAGWLVFAGLMCAKSLPQTPENASY